MVRSASAGGDDGVGAGGSVLLRGSLVRGDRLETCHHALLVLGQEDVSSILHNRLHLWHFGNIFSIQTSYREVLLPACGNDWIDIYDNDSGH